MEQILIVEDDPEIRANLAFQLGEMGFEVTALAEAEQMKRALQAERSQASILSAALGTKPAQAPAPEPAPAPATGEVTRVLLGDDSATMRKIFEMVFRWEGFAVETVASGAQALDAIRATRPDVVVADLSLDDKDGYAICSEVRADAALAGLPVVLLHGPEVEYSRARAKEVGASDELAKPFDTQDLVDKVCALTGATPF